MRHISSAILLLTTLAAAAEPPSKHLQWPIETIAEVTETRQNARETRVTTYRAMLMPSEQRGELVLGFVGVDAMTVDGRAVGKDALPGGPLWQPGLVLSADGDVVGVHREKEVIEHYREAIGVASRTKGADPEKAKALLSDEGIERFLGAATDRYCDWTCAWSASPENPGEHAARIVPTPMGNADARAHMDVWWEAPVNDGGPIVAHALWRVDRKDVAAAGHEGLRAFAAQQGLVMPEDPDATAVVELRTRVEHDARDLRPLKAVVENVLLGDAGATLGTSSRRYELAWHLTEAEIAAMKRKAKPSGDDPSFEPEPTSDRGDRVASVARRVPPRFPPSAMLRKHEGTVLATVRVDAHCKPANVALKESSGSKELDASALASLRRSTYHCALERNVPVAAEIDVPTTFRMQ